MGAREPPVNPLGGAGQTPPAPRQPLPITRACTTTLRPAPSPVSLARSISSFRTPSLCAVYSHLML